MAHAFHVNDTDTNFKSLTAPVPQGSWRQAQHSTLGYILWHPSGSPSSRTNLSPFTKDFRGGEQLK